MRNGPAQRGQTGTPQPATAWRGVRLTMPQAGERLPETAPLSRWLKMGLYSGLTPPAPAMHYQCRTALAGSRGRPSLTETCMHDVSLTLFALTSLALIITPGQDMILVMSRSITQGATAGIVTAAGVSTGLLGHTLLAALGLGAILQASEWLFVALKLAGAAYLLYLGYGLLRTRDATLVLQEAAGISYARLFANGALSNLSNPKVAIFFFAFLPQFVHPGHAHPALQTIGSGLTSQHSPKRK